MGDEVRASSKSQAIHPREREKRPLPDWELIFERNPSLAPPGHDEAAAVVAERWKNRPKCGKVKRGNRKKPKWPSAKHGSD